MTNSGGEGGMSDLDSLVFLEYMVTLSYVSVFDVSSVNVYILLPKLRGKGGEGCERGVGG